MNFAARITKNNQQATATRCKVSTLLTDMVDRLIEHTATCECGRDVELEAYTNDPFRVVRKCDCGKTSICYPFDQEGDLDRLRQWVGKGKS